MFRLQGGDWVAREVVKDIKSGNAKFLVSTGDLVWWGRQGGKPSDNPYWKLVNEDVLKQLPRSGQRDESDAGLRWARISRPSAITKCGTTRTWKGCWQSFPYLKKFGVSDKQLIYKFDFEDVRLIFLWTGKYDYRDPTGLGRHSARVRSNR